MPTKLNCEKCGAAFIWDGSGDNKPERCDTCRNWQIIEDFFEGRGKAAWLQPVLRTAGRHGAAVEGRTA